MRVPGNHARISFVDVTDACRDLGRLDSSCPLAEVWVTVMEKVGAAPGAVLALTLEEHLEETEASSIVLHSLTAATAMPRAVFSSSFRYTNGETPFVLDSSGGRIPRVVVETIGATISFNPDLCWYLDSTFCSHFQELKKLADPSTVLLVGELLIWGIWTCAILLVSGQFLLVARRARRRPKGASVASAVEQLANWSMLLTTLRLISLLAPPIFFFTIFMPCWDCFDFEGAATHEIGHVLGLSHPDVSPLAPNQGPQGQNVYTDFSGGRFDNVSCSRAWDSVRVASSLDSGDATRDSIMLAFSQHTPMVCQLVQTGAKPLRGQCRIAYLGLLWRRGAPLRSRKRSPGRLGASCGASKYALTRPQHDGIAL